LYRYGTVVMGWWREDEWPRGEFVPYKVNLDRASLHAAHGFITPPQDSDDHIRRVARRDDGEEEEEEKTCAHCGATNKEGRNVSRCKGCRMACFCNDACQVAGWKNHKGFCKRFRARS
jgi:hypothetical protein